MSNAAPVLHPSPGSRSSAAFAPDRRRAGLGRVTLLLALVASLALAGAGCASSNGATTAGTGGGTITVSAAASLTASFTTIGEDFMAANPGTEVTFNFDSSGTLSKQILDGASADVFASADEANMAKLTDADLVAGTPDAFARNQLTIVVKKGNPRGVTTLADLATAGTIALCGSDVPCGRYADQILAGAGVTIPADRITRGQNVKATFAAVAEGDADAGIVYVTDVTGDRVDAIAIPDADNASATYPIGVLAASTNRSTAEAFMAYVLSDAGQAVLEAAGFLPPT
jgi:molybdate transport system substrate-binding protein